MSKQTIEDWMEGFDDQKINNAVEVGEIFPNLKLELGVPVKAVIRTLPEKKTTKEKKYGKDFGFVMTVLVNEVPMSFWLNDSARFSLIVAIKLMQKDGKNPIGQTIGMLKQTQKMEDYGDTDLTKIVWIKE